jgi:hypothetical protein
MRLPNIVAAGVCLTVLLHASSVLARLRATTYVSGLTYDLTVFARSTVKGVFAPAKTVRVTVR